MSRTLAVLMAVLLCLGGCSIMESKKIDYKSATQAPSLAVPPDLILPGADNRYAVPGVGPSASTTYSAYSKERPAKPTVEQGQVLPKVADVHVERDGSERWLVVDNMPPEKVWPVVKDFWQGLGFVINVERPDAGVMETDWAENRAKIPEDPIRHFLGKFLDSVYSTGERDKFRTRLEPTPDGKGTEIYISHRGMYEVYQGTQGGGDQGTGNTVWEPRPPDPGLEAEMLRRLMVRFGVEKAHAKTMLAEAKPVTPKVTLQKSGDGAPQLSVAEPFDRTWRRVGLALDRIGFTVEDLNRDAGLYYLRYADPEAQEDKGLLSKLEFWKSGDKTKSAAKKYRVHVSSQGDETVVTVLDGDGKPAANPTGNRIANML